MLETNRQAAVKFRLNTALIEEKADTKKNIKVLGNDLTFIGVRELERTKHVHRLHPYLGKFIPQLVEVFLCKYFKKSDTILDPFAGSGTTLIEANILGMNAVGIELSPFNILIQKVKTEKYDIEMVKKEIKDALMRLKLFSEQLTTRKRLLFNKLPKFTTDSEYLNSWFAERSLQEILFYRSIIPEYKNQDVLKIILSRSARSARLITHYDLARPKKPIREKYWCIKHKRHCEPINEVLKFIIRYSWDTISRLESYDKIRTGASIRIYQGDGRKIKLPQNMAIDGIFTSPPYVGIIDYHEQHLYAYELFNIERQDELEIGPAKNGQSEIAKRSYVKGIIDVFKNASKYLRNNASIFIVANDKC